MPRIFIGYDSSQSIAYDVLRYSLNYDYVYPLKLDQLQKVIGFQREHDNLQSTEFTYTRFLVPYLCDYSGIALFMDSDMLCLGDINELFNFEMSNYAIRVVKHNHVPSTTVKMSGKAQTQYPRKNWSSLMLMDCAKLKLWTKEAVETKSGAWLHRFEEIPDELIGDIPAEWNSLDTMDSNTKMIHYTEGGPWLPNYRDHKFADIWVKYAKEYLYGQV